MFKNPKGSKPVAKNTWAVEVANKTIDHLGATMQRTLSNAITGDGRESLLYIPKCNGLKCTCQNLDPLDLDGKLRPELMASILTNAEWGSDAYPVYENSKPLEAKLGTDDDWGFSTDEHHATNAKPMPANRPSQSEGYKTKVFSLSDLDDESFNPDDLDIKLPLSFEDDPPEDQNNYIRNTGMVSTTSCPICLGTGWVGGYDLYGGTRLTLPVSSASAFVGSILKDANPDYAEMPKGSSLVFNSVILPKGAVRLDECSLWDSRTKIPFKLSIDGIDVPLPRIMDYFDGLSHTLSFKPLAESNVTHAVLQYGTSKLLIDVSTVTITNNNSVYDQQSEVSLALPAITQRALKGAIVYDSTDGKYYRVTSMATSHTTKGWVQNLNLEARIVQPYELVTLLPALGRQARKFNGRFSPTAIAPKHF